MAVVSKILQVLKVQDDSDSLSIRRPLTSDTFPKSASTHPKMIKDVELGKISQIHRGVDVSQIPDASLENNAGVGSIISRRGVELPISSSRSGPKKVTKIHKICEAHEAAGFVLPSGTSAMQLVQQNGSKRALKTPLTQLMSKNQAKTVESSKMLVTVNVCRSTGPLRFLVDLKDPVNRVIELSLRAYAREGRLPHLGVNCKAVELYCANSDFEALDPVQSVGSLGTRHFLLHRRRNEEVEHTIKKTAYVGAMPWKFMWNMMNNIACSH